ncbi:MAG TPA: hypothetical protein VFQ39_04625 [Longimicrobium sp.]|nr:hypothetical protein [Longimicrobium sp.]
MKKIRLDLDTLEVASFSVSEEHEGEGGTVHARQTIVVCSGHATCASACSETNGIAICKSCGPCCYE